MSSSRNRVVVIGSGIAGLIAALELNRRFEVVLVTKAQLEESNTRWAQGGIAAVMFDDDSVAEHIADTLRAGAGLCNPEAVEKLCTEGPQRIRDLVRLGVTFDQQDGVLARGLEAAHSHARILHAGGDSTGLSIEVALARAAKRAGFQIREHTFARELIVQDGRVAGVQILTPAGELEALHASAVVLASGGAGQLFLHTTNPSVATGDGTAMALRAGAQLADLEFYQFHPTALASADTFLISEAVRGEGAVLRDAQGHRFMQAIAPEAELAPRDVVARSIARQMAAQNGTPVTLDATNLGEEFLAHRFPSIDAASRSRGLDWAHQPIPVTPAAHYWMGGVRTDLDGRTSLPGLFAVGEAACTGVHGANRLASNSLLESLVFAWSCAALLLAGEGPRALAGASFAEVVDTVTLTEYPAAKQEPLTERRLLRELMWQFAGIERDAAGLQRAARQLAAWSVEGDSVEHLETANLLQLSRVLVASALARTESRGAHFRLDFPAADPLQAHASLLTQPQLTAVML